jgi:ABC-type proline/glycine betaine transport system ATPase subunit
MRSGRVLQIARGDELERHPADPYVERLLELTAGARGGRAPSLPQSEASP